MCQNVFWLNFCSDDFPSQFEVSFVFAVLDERVPLVLDVEDFIGDFGFTEGLVVLFNQFFEVQVEVCFRIDDFALIGGEVVVRVFAEFLQFINTVNKDFVELKEVLFLFTIEGSFLLFEVLFKLCDEFVHFGFPFFSYVIEVLFFGGSRGEFYGFLFGGFGCFFEVGDLFLFLLDEFEDCFFVEFLVSLVHSDVLS